MATVPTTRNRVTPYRLTVAQYEAMSRLDLFGDDRVELLGGRLVMMTQYPPHILGVIKTAEALDQLFSKDHWSVREDKPLRLGRRWLPLPDIAVVRGSASSYGSRLPEASDIVLLAEVTDTTYAKDRGPKWRHYASVGIATYWIVNLNARRLEVYTNPVGQGAQAAYQTERLHDEKDEVSVDVDGLALGRVAVRDLLP